MRQHLSSRAGSRRPGFTLAELLVAITIVILLVALLLPALNRAYRSALRSADSALIHQLAMACEAYHQVFYEYPPSAWGSPGMAAFDDMRWPPPGPVEWSAREPLWAPGAVKLFKALTGFDARDCSDTAINECGKPTFRGILIDLSPGSGTLTEDKVYGPYFDAKENQYTQVSYAWQGAVNRDQEYAFASRFELFGTNRLAPILYYRAAALPQDDVPASRLGGPGDPGTTVDAWEIYSFADNYVFTDAEQAANGIWDPFFAHPDRHPMYAASDGSQDANGDGRADYGIVRPNSPRTPYNANSFILISPGPDGEYFTEDDVRNF